MLPLVTCVCDVIHHLVMRLLGKVREVRFRVVESWEPMGFQRGTYRALDTPCCSEMESLMELEACCAYDCVIRDAIAAVRHQMTHAALLASCDSEVSFQDSNQKAVEVVERNTLHFVSACAVLMSVICARFWFRRQPPFSC